MYLGFRDFEIFVSTGPGVSFDSFFAARPFRCLSMPLGMEKLWKFYLFSAFVTVS